MAMKRDDRIAEASAAWDAATPVVEKMSNVEIKTLMYVCAMELSVRHKTTLVSQAAAFMMACGVSSGCIFQSDGTEDEAP